MANDQIESIVSLVGARGRSVVSDIANVSTSIPKYNAVLSAEYITNIDDAHEVAAGLGTLIISDLRKGGTRSAEDYKGILQTAYSLPEGLAEKLADKIETEDVIGGPDTGMMESLANGIRSSVEKILNWGSKVLETGWYIDPTQEYDIDFLYEMKLLGGAVEKMNSRIGLMEGQAKLQQGFGLFQTGDVDGLNDGEFLDRSLGNVMGRMQLKNLPPTVMGDVMPLAKLGASITNKEASAAVNTAGAGKAGKVKNSGVKRALDGLLSMNPTKAALLGLATGGAIPIAGMVKDALQARSGRRAGDVDEDDMYGEPYGVVADDYGDNAASAWLTGDVQGLMQAIADEADDSSTSGDPDEDEAIEMIAADEAGDIDTEIGGLFTRARANIAKKKAARRTRKKYRKTSRQQRRNLKTTSRADRKYAKRLELERSRNQLQATPAAPTQSMSDFDPDSFGGSGYPMETAGPGYADDEYINSAPAGDDYYGGGDAYYY
jgi:hypothetical protein